MGGMRGGMNRMGGMFGGMNNQRGMGGPQQGQGPMAQPAAQDYSSIDPSMTAPAIQSPQQGQMSFDEFKNSSRAQDQAYRTSEQQSQKDQADYQNYLNSPRQMGGNANMFAPAAQGYEEYAMRPTQEVKMSREQYEQQQQRPQMQYGYGGGPEGEFNNNNNLQRGLGGLGGMGGLAQLLGGMGGRGFYNKGGKVDE
jgi:hypothetical protein